MDETSGITDVDRARTGFDDRARRRWRFITLCIAAALLAGGYTAFAVWRSPRSDAAVTDGGGGHAHAILDSALLTPPERPFLMFRSTAPGETWKKLMLVPIGALQGSAYSTHLECERAYFAGNRGVCLVEEYDGLATRRFADIFDEDFRPVHRIALTGVPSRTRLTADGRRAAITVFEQGHSYAKGGFSTRTSIVDTTVGRVVTDLEQFSVWRDGASFNAVDFNFWGVTFADDGNRFFATLASGGVKYLVEGNVDTREARVLRTGVECPSLSPDNSRIAYKHLVDGAGHWQLRIHDLRTNRETILSSEARSVDDQVDWLDNDHIMYHVTGARGADLWVLRTDGTEPPRLLRQYAYSPAVVR